MVARQKTDGCVWTPSAGGGASSASAGAASAAPRREQATRLPTARSEPRRSRFRRARSRARRVRSRAGALRTPSPPPPARGRSRSGAPGCDSPSPVARSNVFLCCGQATFGRPAWSPTRPRAEHGIARVRAAVLRRVPLAPRREMEDRELDVAVAYRDAAVARHLVGRRERDPARGRAPARSVASGGAPPSRASRPAAAGRAPRRSGSSRPGRPSWRTAEALWIGRLHHLLPLALVGVDEQLHAALELRSDPEVIVDHHLAEVTDPAGQALQPARGSRQPVGGLDVVHQEPIDQAEQRGFVEVRRQELGVTRLRAAVPAGGPLPAGPLPLPASTDSSGGKAKGASGCTAWMGGAPGRFAC